MAELTPVTFKDVAVCFSEEEWRLLAEWEKQLYKNVMQEIHGALLSLGYAIVNPDIVFRIKKAEPPYPWGKQPQKGTDNLAGSPSFNPDLLLSVTRRKELCSRDRQASEESNICNGSSTDQPAVISAVPVTLKQEEEPCHMKRQDCQIKERINYSKAIHPVVTSVFSLRVKEEETHERGKYMRHPTSNYHGISPEEPFQIPPEEPDFTSDPVSCGRAYTKNELTTGSLSADRNVAEEEIQEICRIFPGKSKESPLQDHAMIFSVKKQLSIKKEVTNTGHRKHAFADCEQWILPIVQVEGHVEDHSLAEKPCTKSKQSNWPVYPISHRTGFLHRCTDCMKSFSEESKLVRHRRTHLSERPYQCHECTKHFRNKYCLLKHWRIHTGEKPYKCAHCDRTFTQDSSLIVHQRTHNGERPYKCEECEKCFTCSSNLIRHQRTHTGLHFSWKQQ